MKNEEKVSVSERMQVPRVTKTLLSVHGKYLAGRR
jgi:hypothetical protein